MTRLAVVALSFALAACGAAGDSRLPPELAPDARPGIVEPGDGGPDDRKRDPGAVCACHDECRSGHCEKLFVCDKDRAVSCSRDRNDCEVNGLPGSACVEESAGTCSPSPRPAADGRRR